MRKLVKDSENNVMELISVNGFIPEGFTEVPAESQDSEELALARKNKMAEIRAKRDIILLQNDKMWLIASKKGESTTDLEADAQTLRDLPASAQTALDAIANIEDLDDIKTYDAFDGLSLNETYD